MFTRSWLMKGLGGGSKHAAKDLLLSLTSNVSKPDTLLAWLENNEAFDSRPISLSFSILSAHG